MVPVVGAFAGAGAVLVAGLVLVAGAGALGAAAVVATGGSVAAVKSAVGEGVCAVSPNCGWLATAGASSTSRLSAAALSDLPHAAIKVTNTSGATIIRINFVMSFSSLRVGSRLSNIRIADGGTQP